jgi:hypothetical protein
LMARIALVDLVIENGRGGRVEGKIHEGESRRAVSEVRKR